MVDNNAILPFNAREWTTIMHCSCLEACFTENVSITIQVRWKFHFALIQILKNNSLQMFWHLYKNSCTWHDSTAVIPCARICRKVISIDGITVKLIFHQIKIVMEKTSIRWTTESVSVHHFKINLGDSFISHGLCVSHIGVARFVDKRTSIINVPCPMPTRCEQHA